ncbi:peptidyl-prolyl cis-trans isomerase FKBP8-like isoform X1 [Xiphophorus maculatus]|uniref:peptidylprolyl isomerase n=1 Tax=Xiphophorus maculatus TaxID=8083 RepID=M3ZKV5_XIPMA|nr:peptidyl-prolyl cis-trans isomerase FKBP8-like isoform X1 [Xiphophorus maculatus]XP_023180945.1 peptidyl-prolyl cis-trans isomerase FKBP8-like isoform X1 [Xiphophorus maculatus]XP_023180951.1 peptidyl-prolyl cis-trans isomerase FKBP8-like isoform X1 [Xiphophorus maculatus]XP_023180960.1 peptidyl-prolyl cis-trans isomerase FKBP8-like isoform X1 [Xiphophorus maculatus]XP_023180967.1 peptidyl-prolyl cis-trans isomerase FKBP8-like isoform X1 [Xiphophorus maculatus]
METEPCCEERRDGVLDPTEPEVVERISEPADCDPLNKLPCGPPEQGEELCGKEPSEIENHAVESKDTEIKSVSNCEQEREQAECKVEKKLKKTNSWKMVRFQDPSTEEDVVERDSSAEILFPEYAVEEWTCAQFEELFMAEDWENITEDQLLRKKILESGDEQVPRSTWGQEVTVKMQGVLEDRTVVEKDCKLVFVIGEGDVIQALEECVMSMQKGEITLLVADSQYAYGLLGREPDIPAWAPLLYQLQLLDIRDKPDPETLPIADRIRIGNQKRERGNFHFQREEYSLAARAYYVALEVLTTHSQDGNDVGMKEEEEEVREYRVKCLNNLATAQLRLEQFNEALHTSRDVLTLQPNNVKALFRTGKLLSDKGEYKEAMEVLKQALKLEPTTKAIHAELSKLVKRQSGGKDTQQWRLKPAKVLGDDITPFLIPSKKKSPGLSWKFILGALVVAFGSLVTSMIMTARN